MPLTEAEELELLELEEQEAKATAKPAPKSRAQIVSEHQDNRVRGQRADAKANESMGSMAATGVARGLAGLFDGVTQMPGLLGAALTQPAQVGKEVVKGAISEPGRMFNALDKGEPEDVFKTITEIGVGALPVHKLGKVTKGAITDARAIGNLEKAENHIMFAQKAEAIPEWNATFRNAAPEIAPEVRKVASFHGTKGVDTTGWATATERAKQRFWDTNIKPLEDRLSGVAVDIKPIAERLRSIDNEFLRINKPGEIKKLENLAASFERRQDWTLDDLRQLRKSANDELEKMGYNSKSFEVQERMRTRPDVQRALAQRNEIITIIGETIDAHAPRTASTRDIMRKFHDLTTIAKQAEARASQVYQQTRANKGKRFNLSLGPFGTVTGAKAQAARLGLEAFEQGRNHPDVLMQKATKTMLEGKAGFGGESLPIRELPKPPSGPILPDTSGPMPMGPQGLGSVFEGLSQGMGAPTQKALPAAPSWALPEWERVVEPKGNVMGVGRKGQVYPQSQHALFDSPSGTSSADSSGSSRLFRGDIRGGYSMADPAQQAEKRRAILGRPYIDSEGNIKYRK